MIGIDQGIKYAEDAGKKVADWIHKMKESGATSFYKSDAGNKQYFNSQAGEYQTIPGTEDMIILDTLREENTVWKNSDSTIVDLGDGILI